MDIIYHERRINYTATIRAMVPGEEVVFPQSKTLPESGRFRVLCSQLSQDGRSYSVNKITGGIKITRNA